MHTRNRMNLEVEAPAPAEEAEAGADAGVDLSMLIRTLGETDRRLEELTGAEIDLVTDREGRSYLLRRAQDRWRLAAADQQAVIIDALPASIALLNGEGVILSVNESWRQTRSISESERCGFSSSRHSGRPGASKRLRIRRESSGCPRYSAPRKSGG